MTARGFVEIANELKDELKMLRLHLETANLADGMQTRRDQLKPIADSLDVLAEIRHQLNVAGIATQMANHFIDESSKDTKERHSSFEADPAQVVSDPANSSFRYGYLRGLNSVIEDSKRRLLEAWQLDLQQRMPDRREDLLDVLWRFAELRQAVAQIRSLQADIERRVSQLPQQESDIHEARAIARKLRDAWQQLPVASLDQEVVDFLQAAVLPEGARRELLTAHVEEWLRENNLMPSVRISVR